jgi:hypothetical protein
VTNIDPRRAVTALRRTPSPFDSTSSAFARAAMLEVSRALLFARRDPSRTGTRQ